MRHLTRLALALILAAAAAAAPSARPVEPRVRAAFDAARSRLPAEWQPTLAKVGLGRIVSMDVPEGAPLQARLLGMGALAYYDVIERRVVVTDAGASGRARWRGPAPEAAAVEAFLRQVYEAPAAPVAGLWARFVDTVDGWSPRPLGAAPLGVARVFDAFLAAAPWRALGGRAPLEELLVHELAHAFQQEVEDLEARIYGWANVVGWIEAEDGRPTNGAPNAGATPEDPLVLVRALLRGGAAGHHFQLEAPGEAPTTYARFDPREDFAESVRLRVYRPAALARQSPRRWFFLRHFGADGRLVAAPVSWPAPPGRWARRVDEAAVTRRALGALWGSWDGPRDPSWMVAFLRAGQPWLEAELVPGAVAEVDAPEDLPGQGPAAPGFRLASGEARVPDVDKLAPSWTWRVEAALAAEAFDEGVRALESRLDLPAFQRLSAELEQAPPHLRGRRAVDLLERAEGVLEPARIHPVAAREADALRALGEDGWAARVAVRFGPGSLPARLAAAQRALAELDEPLEVVEVQAACAEAARRGGDPDRAQRAALAIEGSAWGAVRRVQALARLGLGARARREASSARDPGLAQRLEAEVDALERAARQPPSSW